MASYEKILNTLNFAVSFNPTSAFPIDARSMFGSYTEAVAAAKTAEAPGSTNTVYYYGETLTVYEDDKITQFVIQPDGSLKTIGASVIPDDKTIVLNDTTLGLKSFGTEYFKYNEADSILASDDSYSYPDTMPTGTEGDYVKVSDVWYVYTSDAWTTTDTEPQDTAYYSLESGWKSGLEPKVYLNTDGTYELAWYEPSSTTVEGLRSIVSSLQTDVDSLTTNFNTTSANHQSRIESLESSVTTLNADAETEGSVKYQIAAAISGVMDNPDDTMNSIQELVDWCNSHNTEAMTMSSNIDANATAITAINTLLGTEIPTGYTSSATVIGWITEIADIVAKLGSAAYKDSSEFATAEQGSKADTAVQSVTASSTNGKILVDGVEVTVFEAVLATIDKTGVVRPDGTTLVTDDNGVLSVKSITYSQISDVDTLSESIKTSAVDAAKEEMSANYIPNANIITSTDNIESADDTQVVSAKLVKEMLTWKTTM